VTVVDAGTSPERLLRELIMHALAEQTARNGGVISRAELSDFDYGPGRRRLIDTSKGIWNPRDLEATLSIVSSPDGPYADAELAGALFRYDYRAGSTEGDNRKLRRAMELGLPVIMLRKIVTGVYVPIFPVYVVEDVDAGNYFHIALDESLRFMANPLNPTDAEKRYAQRITQQRLHQPIFRGVVIRAYQTRCAVCSLNHGELLDAAHITPDSDDTGLPLVSNGLSLCKIHHAAYDLNLLGIRPDFVIQINPTLLVEIDGPMLKHGLQEMHDAKLRLPLRPSDRPDRERLAARFDLFKAG
jgi:putative restriction endonuclease